MPPPYVLYFCPVRPSARASPASQTLLLRCLEKIVTHIFTKLTKRERYEHIKSWGQKVKVQSHGGIKIKYAGNSTVGGGIQYLTSRADFSVSSFAMQDYE